MIIMLDQGIENHDIIIIGLELKLLGIRYTPYYAHTGQIPIKIHLSMTFSSRVSSDRLRYDKKC